jgi:hypothetical protein
MRAAGDFFGENWVDDVDFGHFFRLRHACSSL